MSAFVARPLTDPTVCDSRSASEMPIGSKVRMLVEMSDRPCAGTIGTVTGNDGGWAVTVTWDDTERADFMSCRYLQFLSAPAPTAATAAPLALSIDADHVAVTGSVKGDPIHRSILARPWLWSRSQTAYVLPRNLTPWRRDSAVAELKAACERHGVALDVEDSGATLSEAERRENRVERLEARADRHEHAAERASVEANARWSAFKSISDGIPMGQPILVGHHSERGHRADIKRMDGHMAKMSAALRETEERARLAENLRRNLERGDSAVTIGNRIERAEAELRKISRQIEEGDLAAKLAAKDPEKAARVAYMIHPLSDDYRARLEAERDRLSEAIELDRATVAAMVESGAVRVFSKDTVRKGDLVKIRGTWYPVVRVNVKTVTIPSIVGGSWTDTSPWREVKDHRPAES